MSKIYIPSKPAGGSLDIKLLVNYHFPYMHRPTMAGEVMPGVAYDYAVAMIQQGKAVVAGVQIASKVNDDGSTGEEKKASPSAIEKLNWGPPKKDDEVKTKDTQPSTKGAKK